MDMHQTDVDVPKFVGKGLDSTGKRCRRCEGLVFQLGIQNPNALGLNADRQAEGKTFAAHLQRLGWVLQIAGRLKEGIRRKRTSASTRRTPEHAAIAVVAVRCEFWPTWSGA